MFNVNKNKKENRLNQIFDFDSEFTKENIEKLQIPIIECNYNIKGSNYIKGYAYFHTVALVIRFFEQEKKLPSIFDKNYFTLFWNQVLEVEIKLVTSPSIMQQVRILMRDRRSVKLNFKKKENISKLFNNCLTTICSCPVLIITATDLFKRKMNKKIELKNLEKKNLKDEKVVKEEIKEIIPDDSSDSDLDPLKEKKIYMNNIKKSNFFEKNFFEKFSHSSCKNINTEEDFEKLGLKIFKNQNYKFCSSYPLDLVIPKQLSEKDIYKISKFRSKGRIPALTYISKNGKLLFRSSQIQSGLFNKRSTEDEMMVYFIGEPNKKKNNLYYKSLTEGQKELLKKDVTICDARSKMAAVGNTFMGRGYEKEKNYKNIKLSFHNIANLHGVNSSYESIMDTKENIKERGFFKTLGNSLWYEHISDILEFSEDIAKLLWSRKFNVLLHCSDGWDRTSQVSALVQIFMDKKNRSMKFFLKLVQKDFSDFGFQFSKRGGHLNDDKLNYEIRYGSDKNIFKFKKIPYEKESPIFVQFLDCVRQMVIQRPDEFEFGLDFINDLAFYSELGVFRELIFDNYRTRNTQNNEYLSMHEFFEYYRDYYVINKNFFESKNFDILPIRSEDLYFDFWKEYFFCNIPFNEYRLFY